MRFESQWPSHASADPLGAPTIGKTCSSKGSAGSWDRADRHSHRADADPVVVILKDWRYGDKSGTGILAPNAEQRLHPAGVDTDTAPSDFAGWRAWIAAIVGELWSRITREREIRRIRVAAWEVNDDRTLKEIRISRDETEYEGDARHWS